MYLPRYNSIVYKYRIPCVGCSFLCSTVKKGKKEKSTENSGISKKQNKHHRCYCLFIAILMWFTILRRYTLYGLVVDGQSIVCLFTYLPGRMPVQTLTYSHVNIYQRLFSAVSHYCFPDIDTCDKVIGRSQQS